MRVCATYLAGDLPHKLHPGLEGGKHDRPVPPYFREGADTHRYLSDHTQNSLGANHKLLNIWTNGIAGTLEMGERW